MLEYQESVMVRNIKSNTTGYFSRTLFEKVPKILKEQKTMPKILKEQKQCPLNLAMTLLLLIFY